VKLHDLRPAPGARRARTRVGRGIAAGQGKTAGRGTKGQKARTGASIPAWFEGGQTPIHVRVPKLHGFRNRFKIDYQVVNVGQISDYAAAGRFGVEPAAGKGTSGSNKAADQPLTVNAEVLAAAGLVRSAGRPVKVLGEGQVGQKLFVAADAFSAAARTKIEAAGGFVQVLAPQKEPAHEEAPQKKGPQKPPREESPEQGSPETQRVATEPVEPAPQARAVTTKTAPAEPAKATRVSAKPAAAKPATAKQGPAKAAPVEASAEPEPAEAPATQEAAAPAPEAEAEAQPADDGKPARRRTSKKPEQA
jgi:large subunit ribosomal protein L15